MKKITTFLLLVLCLTLSPAAFGRQSRDTEPRITPVQRIVRAISRFFAPKFNDDQPTPPRPNPCTSNCG